MSTPTQSDTLAAQPRIRTMASLGGISLERDVPIDEIADYLRDPDNLVWVDIQDPGEAELTMLMEEFGFHPLALDDVANGVQRPKVDEYRGHMFLVVFGVRAGSQRGSFVTTEIDLFIGRNYVVTCHRGEASQLDEALRRWTRGGEMLREGVGFLVYAVMDSVIDAYFPVVDAIEDELDQIELDIFTEVDQAVPQKLLAMKRDLFTLRRLAQPLREIFGTFTRPDQTLFSTNTTVYFQSLYDQVLRILDAVDAERDMIGSALEAHLTVISTQLNVTMKTLTVVSVVLGTGAAVFGAWGMNVPGLPWEDNPAGFWFVVLGMTGLIVGALLLARQRRWL
jgi:magnesium transporter